MVAKVFRTGVCNGEFVDFHYVVTFIFITDAEAFILIVWKVAMLIVELLNGVSRYIFGMVG